MARPMRRKGVVPSDPAWEAAKAARRNQAHDDAIQEVCFLQRQYRSLWSGRVPPSPVDLNVVLRTLTQKRIRFVLTGAHGFAGWTGRPRNTQDVDILVRRGRSHARAVKAIRELYPHLEVRDLAGTTAFFIPGERESVIDISYPHRADLEDTLANPTWAKNEQGDLRYRIPSLEEALANKYGAMRTLTRDLADRMQDAVDFTWMVRHSGDEGRRPINLRRLKALGEKARPGKGGQEILRLIEQMKAGRVIDLNALMGKAAP